jgi:8-oxo-dGTP pyrophosphatase MutT (NUDIX family)
VQRAFDLSPSKPLAPAHAVAAIVHTTDGRYLLQHRDAIRSIFYPDHWGCFGGAIDAGERPREALARELREELGLDVATLAVGDFGCFSFNVDALGIEPFDRYYYDVTIEAALVASLTLGEGSEMRLVDGPEALHTLRLVPYDGFALWMHCYRGSLRRGD